MIYHHMHIFRYIYTYINRCILMHLHTYHTYNPPSVHPCIHPFIWPSIHLTFIYPSNIHISIHPSLLQSVRPSIHTYIHTYIHQTIHPSNHRSTYTYTHAYRRTDRQTYLFIHLPMDGYMYTCTAHLDCSRPRHTQCYIHMHNYHPSGCTLPGCLDSCKFLDNCLPANQENKL